VQKPFQLCTACWFAYAILRRHYATNGRQYCGSSKVDASDKARLTSIGNGGQKTETGVLELLDGDLGQAALSGNPTYH